VTFFINTTINRTAVNDSLALPVKIIPRGFARSFDISGFIGSSVYSNQTKNSGTFMLNIPKTIELGSSEFVAKIYSSNYASLVEAVEALIKDPFGCFEQTSATTYPMVMALAFLKALPQQTPQIRSLIF
jgi:hypothetical protein